MSSLTDDLGMTGPIAGNVMRVTDSGAATDEAICTITGCVGRQWPFDVPGVNDLDKCLVKK